MHDGRYLPPARDSQALAGCQGKQARGQCRRALSAMLGHVSCPANPGDIQLFRRSLNLSTDRIQTAQDNGEQVVKIMRHTSRKLADNFHLLALPQRLLCFHALRDFVSDTLLNRN